MLSNFNIRCSGDDGGVGPCCTARRHIVSCEAAATMYARPMSTNIGPTTRSCLKLTSHFYIAMHSQWRHHHWTVSWSYELWSSFVGLPLLWTECDVIFVLSKAACMLLARAAYALNNNIWKQQIRTARRTYQRRYYKRTAYVYTIA